MPLRLSVALLAFASVLAPHALAKSSQAPRDVDLCDLIREPKSFEGQMIRVQRHVIFAFEAFQLDASGCGIDFASPQTSEKGVWLTFGGDQPEIATFCCGSPARARGMTLNVAGHKVGLIKDKEFYRFRRELTAQRLRRPDGKPCYDECKFYDVTATLTGLFVAATGEGGYGHLGMYHLLVIERVSGVSEQRSAVPFGGDFVCSSETWEPSPEDSLLLRDSLACARKSDADCLPDVRFGRVAAHWNDDASRGSQTDGYTDANQETVANWISSDLFTSYITRVRMNGRVSVTREHCTPTSPEGVSYPTSIAVACDEYTQSLDETTSHEVDRLMAKDEFPAAWAAMAQGARLLFATGDQSWRVGEVKAAAWYALQIQSQQWHLTLAHDLQFDRCEDLSIDQTPILQGCSWHSADGNLAVDVSLLKERSAAAKPGERPWLVFKMNGRACHPASE